MAWSGGDSRQRGFHHAGGLSPFHPQAETWTKPWLTTGGVSGPHYSVDGKSQLNYPTREQLFLPFFGPPPKQYYNTYDSYAEENLDLPDAYTGKNTYIREILVNTVKSMDMWPVTELFPWRKQEDSMTISWDKWMFDDNLLGRTPEEAVSRLVQMTKEQGSSSTVRRGIALMMEHGFYKTEMGRINFQCHMKQIVFAIGETAAFDAILMLMTWPLYQDKYDRFRPVGNKEQRALDDMFREEIDTWGIIQKTEDGFNIMLDKMKTIFQNRNSGNKPDYFVIPDGMARYIKGRPEERYYMMTGRPRGQERDVLDDTGLRIRESRGFSMGANEPLEDPMFRKQTIGSFAWITNEHIKDLSPGQYRTSHLDLRMFDEDNDELFPFSYAENIRYGGLYADWNGEKMPITKLGRKVLAGYSSWGDLYEKTSMIDKCVRSIQVKDDDAYAEFLRLFGPQAAKSSSSSSPSSSATSANGRKRKGPGRSSTYRDDDDDDDNDDDKDDGGGGGDAAARRRSAQRQRISEHPLVLNPTTSTSIEQARDDVLMTLFNDTHGRLKKVMRKFPKIPVKNNPNNLPPWQCAPSDAHIAAIRAHIGGLTDVDLIDRIGVELGEWFDGYLLPSVDKPPKSRVEAQIGLIMLHGARNKLGQYLLSGINTTNKLDLGLVVGDKYTHEVNEQDTILAFSEYQTVMQFGTNIVSIGDYTKAVEDLPRPSSGVNHRTPAWHQYWIARLAVADDQEFKNCCQDIFAGKVSNIQGLLDFNAYLLRRPVAPYHPSGILKSPAYTVDQVKSFHELLRFTLENRISFSSFDLFHHACQYFRSRGENTKPRWSRSDKSYNDITEDDRKAVNDESIWKTYEEWAVDQINQYKTSLPSSSSTTHTTTLSNHQFVDAYTRVLIHLGQDDPFVEQNALHLLATADQLYQQAAYPCTSESITVTGEQLVYTFLDLMVTGQLKEHAELRPFYNITTTPTISASILVIILQHFIIDIAADDHSGSNFVIPLIAVEISAPETMTSRQQMEIEYELYEPVVQKPIKEAIMRFQKQIDQLQKAVDDQSADASGINQLGVLKKLMQDLIDDEINGDKETIDLNPYLDYIKSHASSLQRDARVAICIAAIMASFGQQQPTPKQSQLDYIQSMVVGELRMILSNKNTLQILGYGYNKDDAWKFCIQFCYELLQYMDTKVPVKYITPIEVLKLIILDQKLKPHFKDAELAFRAILVRLTSTHVKLPKWEVTQPSSTTTTTTADKSTAAHPTRNACPDPCRSSYRHTVDELKQMLKGLSVTSGRFWRFCIENDIPVALGCLLFRPHAEYVMGTMVATVGAGKTGWTFHGHADFQLSDNVAQKMHYGHFTMYSKTVIINPEYIVHGRNVFCKQYLGGMGKECWDACDEDQLDYYRNNQLIKSIFVCIVPINFRVRGFHMDITGSYHPGCQAGPTAMNNTKYPGHDAYRDYWGWRAIKNPHGTLYHAQEEASRWNTIVFQDHMERYSHGTKHYTDIKENKGHWGNQIYDGCGAARRGLRRSLERPTYLQTKTLTFAAA